jgi:hypothetical protein
MSNLGPRNMADRRSDEVSIAITSDEVEVLSGLLSRFSDTDRLRKSSEMKLPKLTKVLESLE